MWNYSLLVWFMGQVTLALCKTELRDSTQAKSTICIYKWGTVYITTKTNQRPSQFGTPNPSALQSLSLLPLQLAKGGCKEPCNTSMKPAVSFYLPAMRSTRRGWHERFSLSLPDTQPTACAATRILCQLPILRWPAVPLGESPWVSAVVGKNCTPGFLTHIDLVNPVSSVSTAPWPIGTQRFKLTRQTASNHSYVYFGYLHTPVVKQDKSRKCSLHCSLKCLWAVDHGLIRGTESLILYPRICICDICRVRSGL